MRSRSFLSGAFLWATMFAAWTISLPAKSSSVAQTAKQVTPQMFGARADGHTDDTAAIQKAIDSSNNVFFPDGTYVIGGKITPGPGGNYLENALITLHSNLTLSGNGKKSILYLKDHLLDGQDDKTSNAHMMSGYNLNNVSISNLEFEMNGAHNLNPPGKIRNAMAIFVSGGSNLKIQHNFFYNCAGHNSVAIRGRSGSGLVLSNNELRNGGHHVGGVENVNNTDFSFLYTEWDNSAVDDNRIEEDNLAVGLHTQGRGPGGIELHASNSHANGNTIVGTKPAFYIAAAPTSIVNVSVHANQIRNSVQGVQIFLSDGILSNAKITDNDIELTQSSLGDDGDCSGVLIPNGGGRTFDKIHANLHYAENVLVQNNVISNSFPLGPEWPCSGMSLHSLHGSYILENSIRGMTGAGMLLLGSPWGIRDTEIAKNKIVDCGRASDAYRTSVIFNVMGSSSSPPQLFYGENIYIRDNIVGNSSSSGIEHSGITLMGLKLSQLKNVVVERNTFMNVPIRVSDGSIALNNPESQNPEVHYPH